MSHNSLIVSMSHRVQSTENINVCMSLAFFISFSLGNVFRTTRDKGVSFTDQNEILPRIPDYDDDSSLLKHRRNDDDSLQYKNRPNDDDSSLHKHTRNGDDSSLHKHRRRGSLMRKKLDAKTGTRHVARMVLWYHALLPSIYTRVRYHQERFKI